MEIPYRAEINAIQGGEFVARSMQRLFEELNAQPFRVGNNAIRQGVGTPNGSVVGDIGDLYLRQDSAAAGAGGQPGLYFKGRNNGTNTGWAIVPPFVRTETSTGTLNDYDVKDASLIRWNNASLTTLTGLKAGYDGQQVTFVSIGAGQVDLAHQNTGSVQEDRLVNFVTSDVTSLAAGTGYGTYIYDGTTLRWRLVFHEQGAWITRTFAAGNFTGNGSMTWTVDSGDVSTDHWYLKSKTLHYEYTLLTTTIGGTPNTDLRIQIPLAYVSTRRTRTAGVGLDGNGGTNTQVVEVAASATLVTIQQPGAGNWSAGTNTASQSGQIAFEVN